MCGTNSEIDNLKNGNSNLEFSETLDLLSLNNLNVEFSETLDFLSLNNLDKICLENEFPVMGEDWYDSLKDCLDECFWEEINDIVVVASDNILTFMTVKDWVSCRLDVDFSIVNIRSCNIGWSDFLR